MDLKEPQVYTDAQLLELLNEDIEKAFSIIFKKYWRLLYKFAFGFIKDQEKSKDIVQEVFLRIYKNKNFEDIETDLRGYLFVAVRRECLRNLDKRWSFTDYSTILDNISNATHPEAACQSILSKELENLISQELEELPPRMKEIFNLSRVEGLSSKQIAVQLGISRGTVRNQISRVLQILKLTI